MLARHPLSGKICRLEDKFSDPVLNRIRYVRQLRYFVTPAALVVVVVRSPHIQSAARSEIVKTEKRFFR